MLQDLVKARDDASVLFYKTYFDLEAKKDKLMKTFDLGKAGIDSATLLVPRVELIENPVIAKHLMLKDVCS